MATKSVEFLNYDATSGTFFADTKELNDGTLADNYFVTTQAGALTVTSPIYTERIVVQEAEPHTAWPYYELTKDKTYTAASYANYGGAVYNNGGTVTGSNVTFSGNTAGSGGAVYNNGGTVTGTNATFAGNTATMHGGAIYNNQSTVNFTGSSVTFTGNTAVLSGGAICNFGSIISFGTANVVFSGNTASGNGGAINNTGFGSTISFTGPSVTFSGNTATNGGAINNVRTINFSGAIDLATESDTWVNANTATVNWDLTGGLDQYATIKNFERYSNASELVKQTITVVANQAVGNYVIATGDLSDLTNKDTFTVKTAEDETGVTLTVGDSNVKYGDTLYYSLANVDNAQLVLTVADTSKRIVVPSAATPSPYALVDSGTYSCGYYNGSGGAVYNNGGTVTGINVTFTGNTANTNGGAIFNNGTVNFTGSSVTFTGNMATGANSYGGAIRNNGTINLTSSSVIFSGNTANFAGGAIDNRGTISFTANESVTFTGNSSRHGGGTILNSGSNSTISFTGSSVTFTGNTATSGVAIYNEGGTISFTGSSVTFSGNTANSYGGAIVNRNSTLTFTGSSVTFIGNKAKSYSGAICNYQSTVNFIGSSVTFSGNTATSVGAIYNSQSTVNFSGTIDLATASDTWVNIGQLAEYAATVNWDLTGGLDQYATIKNFERYSNADEFVKQTITVTAEQAKGRYVIATGDLSNLADNVKTFTITGVSGQEDAAITVGGDLVTYNGATYSLANVDNAQLVLTVADTSKRIVVPSAATPSPYALVTGGTYTCPAYEGNGGAVEVNEGGTVTGINVTFAGNTVTNDYASGNGGAIYNQGTVMISGNACFSSNSATGLGACGGAIHNYNGTLSVAGNATFANNISNTGGAISNNGGTVNVSGNADFTGNATVGSGGAIYNYEGEVSFSGATVGFTGNTAASSGGAIYNRRTISVAGNASFSSNSATGEGVSGGAICNKGMLSVAGKATFASNVSNRGGAIFNNGGMVDVSSDADFTGNTATDTGGAIDNNNDSIVDVSGDADFTGNTAADTGGAIFNQGTVTVSGDADFSQNVAGGTGGAIFNGGTGTIDFTGSTVCFTANTAQKGGAIYNEGGTISVAGDADFTGNAAKNGGAIFNGGTGTIDFTGSTTSVSFTGNTADGSGGAIYNNDSTVNVSGNANFSGNSASSHGGAIYNNGGAVNVSGDADFTGNTAVGSGGAIYNDGGTTNFTGATVSFTGNSANNGGAIYNKGTLSIAGNANFSNNSAAGEGACGGAICNKGTLSVVGNAAFANNVSSAGGAIFNNDGTVNVSGDADFTGNAAKNGGAIYINGDSAAIDFAGSTVSFIGNTASSNGGAIYNNGSTVNVSGDADFTGNTAVSAGGAIYNNGGTISFTGSSVSFSGNTATNGGAINNARTINFSGAIDLATESDTWVNANTATVNWDLAGGLDQYATIKNFERYSNVSADVTQTITVSETQAVGNYVIATGDLSDLTNKDTFTVKTAEDETGVTLTVGDSNVKYGDTLYYSLANVDNAQLVLSVADTSKRIVVPSAATPSPYALVTGETYTCPAYEGNGGAVYVDEGGAITGSNVTFANNNVTTDGGAIYNKGTVNLTDATFNSNIANNWSGGAIHNRGTISFTGSSVTFSGNTANSYGGAIANCNSTLTFTGSSVTFIGNKAMFSSGAIYNYQSTVNFIGSSVTFSGNTATSGGAIYNYQSTVNFSGTIDLATASDTWVNTGYSAEYAATVNWDLTGGLDQYATIKNFERYSNADEFVKQTITVTAEQAKGRYVIATGDLSNLADNVKTFTITGVSGQEDAAITVGGDLVTYNGATYSLANVNNEQLVLINYDDRIEVSGGMPVELQVGKTYTAAPYAGNGGAVYVYVLSAIVTGTNVTFADNMVTDYGGAIYNDGTCTLANATFCDNTAGYGGAIYNNWKFTLAGGTFSGNAANSGGAIYNNSGTISFTGSSVTFSGNTATEKGGAICNGSGTVTATSDATFSGNSAGSGGAIYNDTGTITLTGATFSGNSADSGGALYNYDISNLDNVTFCGNTATSEGGAIHNRYELTVESGTFSGNVANCGGAIYHVNQTINFGTGNIIFSGNTATNGGGAIYNDSGTVNFVGTIDLATESDTWVNTGTAKGSEYATVNWVISGGLDQYGTITNFQRYSNLTTEVEGVQKLLVNQTITVSATQELGDYVIATGDLSNMTNKDTFYFTVDGATFSDAFKVNTLGYHYSDRYYSLTVDDNGTAEVTDDKLTLSVTEYGKVTTPTGLGGVDTLIVGGTYTRIILGGEKELGSHYGSSGYSGSYTISITDGIFASDFMGGDAAAGYVTRTGSITVNVSGGTFEKSLAAGSYFAPNGGLISGSAAIVGDLALNITGGTFAGRVYGGNSAMTDDLPMTVLNGNTYLTINATDTIYFGECIAAGSRGNGIVCGSTNVTVKGDGSKLHFADASVLFGGCSGDYYMVEGGVRVAQTSVIDPTTLEEPGIRALTFDQFTGDFGAEIRMFSDISFANGASVNFTDADLDLKEMENWYFDCKSRATNLNKNKFAGDAISVDTTGLTGSWTLLSGDASAFADLGSASSVTLGGGTATYNGTAWVTDDFSLSVNNQTSLVISKLA